MGMVEIMNAQVKRIVLAITALLVTAVPFARADVKIGRERFFGHNARGPYSIARQNVETYSESITRNGLRLARGKDFTFDPATGMIAFEDSIKFSDVIDIEYRYDPTRSKEAGPSSGLFTLLSSGNGGAGLAYSFRGNGKGEQELATIGFNSQAKFGLMSLTSSMTLDKTVKGAKGSEAQNMAFSGSRDTGALQFKFDYAKVGSKFGQADALKLVKGTENLGFTGKYTASNRLSFSATSTKSETPDAKTKVVKALSQTTTAMNLQLNPGGKFMAMHEVKSEAQGANASKTSLTRMQLDQKFKGAMSASLIQETLTTEKNKASETVKATKLALSGAGKGSFKYEGTMSMSDSDKSGKARDAAIKMSQGTDALRATLAMTDRRADSGDVSTQAFKLESAGKTLKWAAAFNNERTSKNTKQMSLVSMEGGTNDRLRFNTAYGMSRNAGKAGNLMKLAFTSKAFTGMNLAAQYSRDTTGAKELIANKVNVGYEPNKGFKLIAGYTEDATEKGYKEATNINLEAKPADNMKLVASMNTKVDEKGEGSAQTVAFEAKPTEAIRVAASMNQKEDEKGQLATQGITVEAKPAKTLQVAAAYGTSEDKTGESQDTKVSVAATGSNALKLTASVASGTTPAGPTSATEAAVSVIPIKDRMSFTGSFRQESKPTGAVEVSTIQADLKPSSALAVSGYLQSRDGTVDHPDTVNAQVTLGSTNALKVVGTYSENPEEKNVILPIVRQGLALQTSFSGLTFSGGYLRETNSKDNSEGMKAEVKLGIKFSPTQTFEGGYQQTVGAVRGFKPMLAYNMKYNHTMGDRFKLSVDANVSRLDPSVPIDKRNDVKATANLGIAF